MSVYYLFFRSQDFFENEEWRSPATGLRNNKTFVRILLDIGTKDVSVHCVHDHPYRYDQGLND